MTFSEEEEGSILQEETRNWSADRLECPCMSNSCSLSLECLCPIWAKICNIFLEMFIYDDAGALKANV